MERYRHEIKYLIDVYDAKLIKDRISKIMKKDAHASNGSYLISSLYFDDYDDSCYYDVESGIDLRNKYRIRTYNHRHEIISLESKFKRNSMTFKRTNPLSEKEAKCLVGGKYLRNFDEKEEIKKELSYLIMTKQYHPAVIVEYERIPYVYEDGNVRITLDFNICSSNDVDNFLGNFTKKRPILEENKLILEVKYDDYLPDIIYDCINIGNMEQLSISKYALCRRYSIGEDDLL